MPVWLAARSTVLSCVLVVGCVVAEQTSPAGYSDETSAPTRPTLELSAFESAKTCGACHPQHYAEWQGSAHAHAMSDPVFQALVLRQRAETGGTLDRFCTQCHALIANRSAELERGFSFDALPALAQEGVTCVTCHRATEQLRLHGAGLTVDPGAPIQGPFADATAPHATQASALLSSAQFCAACHDVQTPAGLDLERPFQEWSSSPAAATARPCQTCHLPTYAGEAATVAGAPRRPNLHRHWFTGVDLPSHGADSADTEQRRRSEALLDASASVALDAQRIDGATLGLAVTVTNLVDGHNLPTGSSFFRQLWLELVVLDARGSRVFASGVVSPGEDLEDAAFAATPDPQLALFGGTLRDAHGSPTLYPWQAASLLQSSLAPLEARRIPYIVPLGSVRSVRLTVRARLRFRSYAPRLLRSLALDPGGPIVDVASAELDVSLGG